MGGRRWLFVVFVMAWLSGPRPVHAGKLGAARSEVRGSSSSSSSSSSSGSSSSSSSSSSGDGDSDGGGSFGDALGEAIVDAVREHNERLGPPLMASYPYADGARGYVLRVPDPVDERPGRVWAARASLEGAYMGDGVWRSQVDVEASAWRVSLRNSTGLYLEPHTPDAMYLGHADLLLSLVMQGPVMWRLGGGLNYMIDGRTPGTDRREYALGVNGSTMLDVFITRPVIASISADVGTLYAARTFAVRGTLGVALRRFELFGGYEHRQIGRVPFRGPVAGLRVWF